MDSYWASLTLILAAIGAVLKYLVWDFFHKPESMHKDFSAGLAQAQAFIYQRKFLPPMEDVVETVITRREFLPAAPVIQIMAEASIDADIRQAAGALIERIELERSYQRAATLCSWVAGSWLIVCLAAASLFFVFHHSSETVRPLFVKLNIGIMGLAGISAGTLLWLFLVVRNKFVRIIGINQY